MPFLIACLRGLGIAALWLLRQLGAAVVAIVSGLWGLVMILLTGAAHGVGNLLRQLLPWAVGAAVLLFIACTNPVLFQQLLILGVMIGALVFVARRVLGIGRRQQQGQGGGRRGH